MGVPAVLSEYWAAEDRVKRVGIGAIYVLAALGRRFGVRRCRGRPTRFWEVWPYCGLRLRYDTSVKRMRTGTSLSDCFSSRGQCEDVQAISPALNGNLSGIGNRLEAAISSARGLCTMQRWTNMRSLAHGGDSKTRGTNRQRKRRPESKGWLSGTWISWSNGA